MKIMIIDDSNTMRFMILKMLREIGHQDLTAASSAEEAIPVIIDNPFDLILLDWNLPRMSGLDLLKYLKSTPSTKDIPVIIVTTLHDKSAILQAVKAGVHGYLLKPVSREVLSAKLDELQHENASKSG